MSLDNISEAGNKDVNDMVDIGNVDEEMSFEIDWHQYESDIEATYEESLVEDEQIIEPKEVKIDYSTVDDPVLQTSLKIFQYAKKKGVSREALDGIIGMVNNHMKAYCSEAPLLYSHYKSKERLTKRFPIKAKELDVCKNGCMLYDENAQIDEKCSNSKCEGNKIDAKKMMYLPLIDQLALLVNDKETFELLKSPRKNEEGSDVLYGVFDGALGERLPKVYSKKKGRLVIYLGLFADGFQIFKNGQHTMTAFHLIILNLPEVVRTESKYMLQVCVVPGPTSPKDFFSFVKPIMKELMILEREGFKLAGSNMTINAHLLFAGGDIPACAKLAGQSGHTHPSGCRCCTIKAVRTEGRNVFYPSNSIAYRTKASFTMTDVDSGQKLPTPFAGLKRFHGAFFFPVDLMHLFGCNVGPQIARLITTDDFSIDKRYQHPLRLTSKDIQNINSLLRLSCPLVPTTFSGVIENVESVYNRAVDWIHFLRYTLPTTVASFFDKSTRQKIMCISKICNLACQRDITRMDVDVLRAQILEWISWLKELTDDGKIQPWAFNLNQHFLLHLPDLILFLGPMPSYAAFSIERTIQEYKTRIKSRKDPFTNSGNVLIELASSRWIERAALFGNEDKIKAGEVLLDDDEENEYEVWGPINRVKLRNNEEVLDFDCFRYLKAYFDIQSRGSNNAFDPESIVEFGSRLWSPDGTVFGCSVNHKRGNRASFFIKLCLKVNTNKQRGPKIDIRELAYFGEAIVYLRYRFPDGCLKLLALVKIFNVKCTKGEIWPYKTPSASYKVKLVNVDEIISLCGRSIDANEREYIFWPYQEKYDVPLGDINLL